MAGGEGYNDGNSCDVAQAWCFPLTGTQITTEVDRVMGEVL